MRNKLIPYMVIGAVDEAHPLFQHLVEYGNFSEADQRFFEEHKASIDERGGDYYISHEGYDYSGPRPWANKKALGPPEAIREYREHYATILPSNKQPEFSITETNILGYDTDRATWLKFILDQAEKAGVTKVYWYPFLDSTGWSSGRKMLREQTRKANPVGVLVSEDYSNVEGRNANIFF